MPFIVLGAVIAGILEELLPQQLIAKIMPGYAVPAVMIGGLLGLIFPMCECGIVVVMRRLLRKGLPLACCISYMLAGPIVNVVVLMSTYVAFGGLDESSRQQAVEMTLLRAGMGFTIACITGLVVFFLERKHGKANLLKPIAMPPAPTPTSLPMAEGQDDPVEPKDKSLFARLGRISETTLHDFVDITVFLIIGAVLAALAKLFIGPEEIGELSQEKPFVSILAMMGLAVVMCLCSEADAFVAASFTEMAASSKLAFLVLGPMFDIKLLLLFTRVFRTRLIIAIVATTVVLSGAASMGVHELYNPPPVRPGESLLDETLGSESASPSETAGEETGSEQ